MMGNAVNRTGRSRRCLSISDLVGASVKTGSDPTLSSGWGNCGALMQTGTMGWKWHDGGTRRPQHCASTVEGAVESAPTYRLSQPSRPVSGVDVIGGEGSGEIGGPRFKRSNHILGTLDVDPVVGLCSTLKINSCEIRNHTTNSKHVEQG